VYRYPYRGDGRFQRFGMWPLTTYILDFEPFPLRKGEHHHYRLRGWHSHWHTWLQLTMSSPEPLHFSEMNLVVAVQVKDASHRMVLPLASDLNSHLKRMRQAGEALWENGEWQCRYDWGSPEIQRQAVPFIRGVVPRPQATFICDAGTEMPERSYDIDIECIECPSAPGLQLQLTLTSGWK